MIKVVLNTEIKPGEGRNFYRDYGFSPRILARQVIRKVLVSEGCPYDVCADLILTGPEEIRELNRDYRGIDSETDVLSFPGTDFEVPSGFDAIDRNDPELFDPDTGLWCIGSIVLNAGRVVSQARDYGHSVKREYAFLTAHSVLHLLGYDHETPDEAALMEKKQDDILNAMGITRCQDQ
ncbi:MAG: rRNA maturation RNase YbeY [Lachnospiraceae bacterium]|nr:rRNA maturation RNase YbeY [Lachnospiraceae bacterium]